VSEFTRFMDGYLQQHPAVLTDQQRGWNIWWNRYVDLGEWERAQQDTVPLPPYYYPE
jgi:hypothetical protein